MTFLNWVTFGYLFCKIESSMLITSVLSWLERLHGMQEVVGSTPISSTSFFTQNLLISRGQILRLCFFSSSKISFCRAITSSIRSIQAPNSLISSPINMKKATMAAKLSIPPIICIKFRVLIGYFFLLPSGIVAPLRLAPVKSALSILASNRFALSK
jgi:hypothetical protein